MKWLGLTAALLATTATGQAEGPATPTVGAKVMGRPARKPKSEASPPAPPPDVSLALEAPATRGPWIMRVTNQGDVPVQIVADTRLLSVDVTPRGMRKAVHCELPDDMRPTDSLSRAIVVPPKRAYVETLEPRLYCFAGKLDVLAPGAIVVGHLGWTAGRKSEPPFVVSPIEGVAPGLQALKSIDSPPIALPDEPSSWQGGVTAVQTGDADVPPLSLRGSSAVDAPAPNNIEIPVTLRNDGRNPVIVRFRPEVLQFDVMGPGAIERCAWPTPPAAPLREMFTTLAPKASTTLDITLSSYCTGQALDQPGLVIVRPRIDTREASGAALGLRTFDGELMAAAPTVVRLHRGAAPPPPLVRPQLAPVTSSPTP